MIYKILDILAENERKIKGQSTITQIQIYEETIIKIKNMCYQKLSEQSAIGYAIADKPDKLINILCL